VVIPSSLNTFRVVTFRFAQTGSLPICSYLKVGRENSVVDLAVHASGHFSQMGILGWDIALTNSGPTLIEVNATPSIDNLQVVFGGLVTDEMAEVLKPRHIFSRYPKTHMYPRYLRGGHGRI